MTRKAPTSQSRDNLTSHDQLEHAYGATPEIGANIDGVNRDDGSLWSRFTSVFMPAAKDPNEGTSRRYYLALMGFLGFCNVYAMRVNMTIAVLEMTSKNNRDQALPDNSDIAQAMQPGTLNARPEFDWSERQRSVILAAFFYGYILTQIPGGWLAQKYGGRLIFGFGVLGTAVLTLLTPPLALLGYPLLLLARVLEGMCEGVTYPAMHAMWSHWAPPAEKTRLATIAMAGSYFGTVISLPISAYLGKYSGWPSIFYFFGVVAVIWSVVWFKTISETPKDDPRIDHHELMTITNAIGFTHEQQKHAHPPWADIMRSKPVWAVTVAHLCENWGFYTMLTYLPRFMEDVMGESLEKASFETALPYLLMGIVLLAFGQIADYMRTVHQWETGFVRRSFGSYSMMAQATFTILAGHAPNISLAEFCIVMAIGLGGIAWSGFSVNHLDIAPQYASLLMGLSNTFATLPGMVSPLLVGSIVGDHGSPWQWRFVFYMSAIVYIVGGALYWLWASGEQQPWARVEDLHQVMGDDDPDDVSERRASEEIGSA